MMHIMHATEMHVMQHKGIISVENIFSSCSPAVSQGKNG